MSEGDPPWDEFRTERTKLAQEVARVLGWHADSDDKTDNLEIPAIATSHVQPGLGDKVTIRISKDESWCVLLVRQGDGICSRCSGERLIEGYACGSCGGSSQ